MAKRSGDDIRELLVLSMLALHMIAVDFAKFLGVSDRTLRRWTTSGTRLTADTLVTLATAVHAKDPQLAARLAAIHGQTFETLGIGSAENALSVEIVRAAGDAVGGSWIGLRPAVAAAFEHARAAGLTMDAACALFAAPAEKDRKRSG